MMWKLSLVICLSLVGFGSAQDVTETMGPPTVPVVVDPDTKDNKMPETMAPPTVAAVMEENPVTKGFMKIQVQDKQNTTENKPAPGTVYSQSYDMPEKKCSALVREDRLPTGETVQNIEGRVDGYRPKEDCVEMCFMLEHCSGVVYDPDKKTCIGYNDTAQEYNDTNSASQTKMFLIYSIHCKQIEPPLPIYNVTTTLTINCTEMFQNQVYQISFDRSYLEKSDMTLRDYSPDMFFLTKMKWMRKPEMNETTFHGQCKMNCWMLSLRKMIPKTVNNVLYLKDCCFCLDTVDNNMEDSKNTLAEMKTEGLIDNSTAMAIGRNIQCNVVNATEYITGSVMEECPADKPFCSQERGIEFDTLKKDQINLMGQ